MTDTPGDVAAKLEEALAVVESFDGGRAIQVGLGTYDSKQIDISLRDLRAAASLIREMGEREKALRKVARELSIFATHAAGGGSEMFKTVAGEFYADAEACRARYDHRQQTLLRIGEARASKALERK